MTGEVGMGGRSGYARLDCSLFSTIRPIRKVGDGRSGYESWRPMPIDVTPTTPRFSVWGMFWDDVDAGSLAGCEVSRALPRL